MSDFLAFRTMVASHFIQVVFLIGLAGLFIVFLGALSNDQALVGLLFLVFGALYWRILCELFIVFFRMNDTLKAIKEDTATFTGRGPKPDSAVVPTESLAPVAELPVETA